MKIPISRRLKTSRQSLRRQPMAIEAPRAREADLYGPVKDWLVENGYTVRAEVLGCDVTAVKEDALVVIELKLRISLELLLQAARRQRITDSVYVAVPRQAALAGKKWRELQHLLKRLELGLIVVNLGAKRSKVEVLFHPVEFRRRKTAKKRRAVLQEARGRLVDGNTGGSTRRKLLTVYREEALRIAVRLVSGPNSPKALRKSGTCKTTGAILYDNVYGWFQRVERGVYGLTEKGDAALIEYGPVIQEMECALAARDAQ